MKVWLNHRLVDEKKAVVSVMDHSFLYGDGVYETVRVCNGRVMEWPAHERRLRASADAIRLSVLWNGRYLEKAVRSVAKANGSSEAVVRITISRGAGSLGLDPRTCTRPTLVIAQHPPRPLDRWRREGVSIGIAKIRRNHPLSLNPNIKSNSSLNTVLAKMEAISMHVFDVVLQNVDGFLSEGTTSNLFFMKGGVLFTPSLDCGLLPGVTRSRVIQLARKAGWTVREGRWTVRDLWTSEACFLTSTGIDILGVRSVMQRMPKREKKFQFPNADVEKLQDLYRRNR